MRPARGSRQGERLPPLDPGLTSATYSPDGRYVLTTGVDHDARLLDARTGQQVWVLSHAASVSDADFSADGRWVAIAGPGYAGIVDARTGERILLLDGNDRTLRSVAFSPTGWRIATGGQSGAVRDLRLPGLRRQRRAHRAGEASPSPAPPDLLAPLHTPVSCRLAGAEGAMSGPSDARSANARPKEAA